MDVVIPIASEEPAFEKSDFGCPRPLVRIDGRPVIRWATDCLQGIANESSYIFPVLQSHIKKYSIDEALKDIFNNQISIVPIREKTEGAAETVLKAEQHISQSELIILFGDQYIEADIKQRITQAGDIDGLIPVFKSSDPKWSYAATTRGKTVTKVAEKEVISQHATVGLYYFTNGMDFVKGVKKMMSKNIRTNGLFYVCPVYNEIINMSKNVEIMPVSRMNPLSSPEHVKSFERIIKKQ